jgi:orotidine-5'-phosphate decarboxylase
MTFHERSINALTFSSVCIGLDTDPALLPAAVNTEKDPALAFNCAIIDATCDLVGAYKPNFAFYEAMGIHGWRILVETVKYIRTRTPKALLIADAKRGDIGNTSLKYAQAILYEMDFDCITLSPYMGSDSIEPFIQDEKKGAFILCLTSNKGSDDFQRLESGGMRNYEHVIRHTLKWNSRNNCGLVVGATHPQEMIQIRGLAGNMPFLVPGIGAQGGDLESVVKANYDGSKVNALVNSSRGIIYASKGKDFAERAREETLRLKQSIDESAKEEKK